MKITLLQGAFLPVPPLRGGAVEKMWFLLGQEFARLGHEVTHVSRLCDDLPASETIAGVRHIRVPGYEQPKNALRLKWRDLCYSFRACRAAPAADVVVTNTFWSPLLLKPAQGAIYVDVQRMPKGQMRLYRRAARLRANSSSVQAAILAQTPAAAPRVRVIPNPLPFIPSHGVRWKAKERTVLYVGRLHPEKGIELLLAAWSQIQADGTLPGWKLKLIGPSDPAHGGGGERWLNSLKIRHADETILWLPPLYDIDALNHAYERASVFVYPSLATQGETFGLSVLEAMAWGAVPVVSGLACFRDFVEPARNGFVFDHTGALPAENLAQALVQAADSAALACGQAAVEVRRTHHIQTIAAQFLDDFATLTPARPS